MTRPVFSKAQKKTLSALAEKAHDIELGQALDNLFAQFIAWKEGKLSPTGLNQLVHDYHQGIQRQIWSRHSTLNSDDIVASSIASGILDPADLPGDLLRTLEPIIKVHRMLIGRSDGDPSDNG